MMMLTDLADAARKSGLKVVEVAGWRTRGHGQMSAVKTITCHHTAGLNALAVVRDGHAGLKGPLAQIYLDRAGVVYIVAAGLCWHAGASLKTDYENQHAIGIEAEATGVDAWPAVQYDAYVRLCRALVDHYRLTVADVRGHKETAAPKGRKIDPNFSMDAFRAAIAAKPQGGTVSIFDETVTYRDRKEGSGVTNRDMSFREWLTAHSNDETAAFFRTTDTRTRVIAMEKQLAAIAKTLDALAKTLDTLTKTVGGGDASGTYTGTLTLKKG